MIVIPFVSLCLVLGWGYVLMMESIRLQNEWLILWQETLFKQSLQFHHLDVPKLESCNEAENKGMTLTGETLRCHVVFCEQTWHIQCDET